MPDDTIRIREVKNGNAIPLLHHPQSTQRPACLDMLLESIEVSDSADGWKHGQLAVGSWQLAVWQLAVGSW